MRCVQWFKKKAVEGVTLDAKFGEQFKRFLHRNQLLSKSDDSFAPTSHTTGDSKASRSFSSQNTSDNSLSHAESSSYPAMEPELENMGSVSMSPRSSPRVAYRILSNATNNSGSTDGEQNFQSEETIRQHVFPPAFYPSSAHTIASVNSDSASPRFEYSPRVSSRSLDNRPQQARTPSHIDSVMLENLAAAGGSFAKGLLLSKANSAEKPYYGSGYSLDGNSVQSTPTYSGYAQVNHAHAAHNLSSSASMVSERTSPLHHTKQLSSNHSVASAGNNSVGQHSTGSNSDGSTSVGQNSVTQYSVGSFGQQSYGQASVNSRGSGGAHISSRSAYSGHPNSIVGPDKMYNVYRNHNQPRPAGDYFSKVQQRQAEILELYRAQSQQKQQLQQQQQQALTESDWSQAGDSSSNASFQSKNSHFREGMKDSNNAYCSMGEN